MRDVEISRCGAQDITQVMDFIGAYWQKNHVLSTHRALMDWQHRAPDGAYHYLLARRGDTLLGVLGYIPTTQFDGTSAAQETIWLALWKIRDDATAPGLGLRMLGALTKLYPHATWGVNGINPEHPPMYRALGYRSVALSQHYLTHPTLPLRMVTAPRRRASPGSAVFEPMNEAALAELTLPGARAWPIKTPSYFAQRFLRHPFYAYRVWGVHWQGSIQALIATRLATHEGSSMLRMVDFSGAANIVAECGTAIETLLVETGAEAADFWQYGMQEQYLAAAGFGCVDPASTQEVVPNYFEPFLARNARILCVIKPPSEASVLVCRADGDQDRPNRLP